MELSASVTKWRALRYIPKGVSNSLVRRCQAFWFIPPQRVRRQRSGSVLLVKPISTRTHDFSHLAQPRHGPNSHEVAQHQYLYPSSAKTFHLAHESANTGKSFRRERTDLDQCSCSPLDTYESPGSPVDYHDMTIPGSLFNSKQWCPVSNELSDSPDKSRGWRQQMRRFPNR